MHCSPTPVLHVTQYVTSLRKSNPQLYNRSLLLSSCIQIKKPFFLPDFVNLYRHAMDSVAARTSASLHGEHPPRTGGEEEEENNHEKKPVMKKVKDKVKKIKNAITKKSHGHANQGDDKDHHQHGDFDEGDEEFVEDDEMEEPEVHGAPIYESSAIGMRTGGKEMSGGRGGGGEGVGDGFGPKTEAERKMRNEHIRGGEEAEALPELSHSLEALTVSTKNERGETELSKDNNSSYAGMVSSAASKVYGMVADAGTAVISKVKPDARKDGGDGEAGNEGKGLSIKEYLTEKLTPGEDEKALSELITEGGRKSEKDEVQRKVGAGVVERLKETVTALLGGGESSAPATEVRRKVAEDRNDFHR